MPGKKEGCQGDKTRKSTNYPLDPGPSGRLEPTEPPAGPSAAQGPRCCLGNEGMGEGTTDGKDLVPILISAFLDPATAQLTPLSSGYPRSGSSALSKGVQGP